MVLDVLSCPFVPFCDFQDSDTEIMMQHVYLVHSESTDGSDGPDRPSDYNGRGQQSDGGSGSGESWEGATSASVTDAMSDFIDCHCGEYCLLAEFDDHLEMHNAEGMVFGDNEKVMTLTRLDVHHGDASTSDSKKHPEDPPQHSNASSKLVPFARLMVGHRRSDDLEHEGHNSVSDVRTEAVISRKSRTFSQHKKKAMRLGSAELGPFADEQEMPRWLREILEKGAKVTMVNEITQEGNVMRIEQVSNEIRGIIPVISQLCFQDDNLSRAYMCHPDVTHVVKISREGGFCGYRNIQMMISHIIDAKLNGSSFFEGRIPTILQLQDMIEYAWDIGFNAHGRVETGGIRGTRKYIGTQEAQALLQSLNFECLTDAFTSVGNPPTYLKLLRAVETYFLSGNPNLTQKMCRTSMPPIYFQHPGHSLTIVGFERQKSGEENLLVFDPMFKPSSMVKRLIGARSFRSEQPTKLLKAYRRGASYLRKHKTFEILMLTSHAPTKQGWDGQ